MANFRTIMKIKLGENHLRLGRTRHEIADARGRRAFPPFVRLEIAQYPGDSSYYLLHISEDGQIADTNHETVEEAMHQAEFEFGVNGKEWEMVQPD